MPNGSIVEYDGKRGTIWRIQYRDADGRQVKETIGAERDGVTRKQAASELRERVVRVERKAYRRPKPLTFAEYAGPSGSQEGRCGDSGSRARCCSTARSSSA